MTVTLKVGEHTTTAITGITMAEDASPLNPASLSGGIGTFSATLAATEWTTPALHGTDIELDDTSQGRAVGKVDGISSVDGMVTINAASRLNLFVCDVTAQPFVGRLDDAFAYYASLVGVTDGIEVDVRLANRPVTLPGFVGDLWHHLKMLCVAEQIEISIVEGIIMVRPPRDRDLPEIASFRSEGWAVASPDLAQAIEISYYNNEHRTNDIVYPPNGWNYGLEIYTVEAGQTEEFDIPVNVSLESVVQPVPEFEVDRHDFSGSKYSVAGNDGLPIEPQWWIDEGGSLTVAISPDDPSMLRVTLVGPRSDEYGPYRIAQTSNVSGDEYSTLRVLGTGVFHRKEDLTILTGADPATTPREVGATIENPFISTAAQAYTAGHIAAGRLGSAEHTISLLVNRPAERFGNVAGSRIRRGNTIFRIDSAPATAEQVSLSATSDITVADLDQVWSGKTLAEIDTHLAGKTIQQIALNPLEPLE